MIENPNRSPEDVAASVARWVARGGSLMNYYMYFGGQHFGAAAAAGVLNSYADGVNLHSDGLPNEPKRSHLAALHYTLLAHADTIMGTARPIHQESLGGEGLTAWVFGDGGVAGSGELVFLENSNGKPGMAAGHRTTAAANCSFPIDLSRTRYKGLTAAATAISSEVACAAACCAGELMSWTLNG